MISKKTAQGIIRSTERFSESVRFFYQTHIEYYVYVLINPDGITISDLKTNISREKKV